MTHLPCLDVEFKHELLLFQTFLIIARLGLLTDDYARRQTRDGQFKVEVQIRGDAQITGSPSSSISSAHSPSLIRKER